VAPNDPVLTAATPGNGQVTLTWTAPTQDGGISLTHYHVYRDDVQVALLDGVTLTYVDTGLTNGTLYHYRVSAENSVGEGPQSNELTATPAGFSLLDDFQRPDSTNLGANWSGAGGGSGGDNAFQISGGFATGGGGTERSAMWLPQTFSGDHQAGSTIGSIPAGVSTFYFILSSTQGNPYTGYIVSFDFTDAGHTTGHIYRGINGSYSDLTGGVGNIALANGDFLKTTRVGNLIRAFRNGTQILSVTDSSPAPAGGKIGMGFGNQAQQFLMADFWGGV